MKTNNLLAGVVIVTALAFSGCAKDGATGPAGTAGKDGNANVIATNNVTISSWTPDNQGWVATINAAGITQNIVDKGVVQVFIKYGSAWISLPDIEGINSTAFGFYLGNVTLGNYNSDNSAATNPGSQTFRIVIISASNRMANPNTNWRNYNEVKKIFNLKD